MILSIEDFCLTAPDSWRFCKVGKPGVTGEKLKQPFEKDWQTKTYDCHAIKTAFKSGKCQGFGLVAGGDLILLDVDGENASQRLAEVKGANAMPATVGWTSGKPGRYQLAFNLSQQQREDLLTAHLATGGKPNKGRWFDSVTANGITEQVDFRYAGHQSVLPPSPHPETAGYRWLENQSPAAVDVAQVPDWLFDYLLSLVGKPEPAQPQAKPNTSAAGDIPLEICLSLANRDLLAGVGSGGRNDAGARLARDLIGAEDYLTQAGYRVEQSARSLFDRFCAGCSPAIDSKESEQIWRSAEGDKPTPCLSGQKIENCISGWQRRQNKSGITKQQTAKSEANATGKSDETTDAIVFNFLLIEKLYSEAEKPWKSVNGKLYQWNGSFYQEHSDESQLARIQKLAEDTSVYCEDKDKNIWPFAKVAVVKSGLDWAKMKFVVDPDECNPPGINCTNGVRVWNDSSKEFDLLPHSPERYYLYAPMATYTPDAPDEDCDRLLAALEPAQQQVLLRTVAAAIDLPLVRKRRGRAVRAILARGTGSNGKDANREAFSMLWGRTGCTSIAVEDFAEYDRGRKFGLAGLRTARINWASENSGAVNLDRVQSLKKAITGDPIHFELKGRDQLEFIPNAIQVFNVNDIPRLGAAQEAIRSRFAVLEYNKVYRIGADKSKGELEADPRLKYDPDFIQANILPSLLNKVEQAFKDLLTSGIDYSCTDAALEEIQSFNSHLWDFVRSVGLEPDPSGTVAVADIWASLETYYRDNGLLEVDRDVRDSQRKIHPIEVCSIAGAPICLTERFIEIPRKSLCPVG